MQFPGFARPPPEEETLIAHTLVTLYFIIYFNARYEIKALVFQAVRNKEVDMKGAAELLGVSYGTLYGRYREVFGYLKHGWNSAPSYSSIAAASQVSKVAPQSATNMIPRLELSAALEAGV